MCSLSFFFHASVNAFSFSAALPRTNTPRKEGGLGKMRIPLLADLNKSISENYGVLLKDAGIALRGLFIIDEKGVLRQSTVNDLPVGRSVDETLRLVQAFQFTDKHGEVCPANWKPGADTVRSVWFLLTLWWADRCTKSEKFSLCNTIQRVWLPFLSIFQLFLFFFLFALHSDGPWPRRIQDVFREAVIVFAYRPIRHFYSQYSTSCFSANSLRATAKWTLCWDCNLTFRPAVSEYLNFFDRTILSVWRQKRFPPFRCSKLTSFLLWFLQFCCPLFEACLIGGRAQTLMCLGKLNQLCWVAAIAKGWRMGPVWIRYHSHHFATQSSHSVDRAGLRAKLSSIEIWIPWRNAHGRHHSSRSAWIDYCAMNRPLHNDVMWHIRTPFLIILESNLIKSRWIDREGCWVSSEV